MPDETNLPVADEQINDAGTTDDNSQETVGDAGGESGSAPSVESLTPERQQELLELEASMHKANITDPKAFYTRFHEVNAENAENRRSLDGYRQQEQAAQQQRLAQEDPLAAMQRQRAEFRENYDHAAADALGDRIAQVTAERQTAAMYQRQEQQRTLGSMNNGIAESAARFGVDANEIDALSAAIQNDPAALGVALAYQKNPESVRQHFLKEDRASADRKASASLAASGMGARGNGPGAGNAQHEHVNPALFLSWAEHAQDTYVKEHGLPGGIDRKD